MNYLQKYQQHLGLEPDGVIGKLSKKAMMQDMGWKSEIAFVHGMGQAKLESGNYSSFRESLNYKPQKILEKFNTSKIKRFSKEQAERYGRTFTHKANQQMIANIAYANRNGNGDIESGDGWFFRGGLAIQVTFRRNWLKFFEVVGLPTDTDPDSLVDDPRAYFMAIKFYFDANKMDSICTSFSSRCILNASRLVNVGRLATTFMPHDWQLREKYTKEIAKTSGVIV